MTKSSHTASSHIPVQIFDDTVELSTDDVRVLELLIQVAKLIDSIYLKQSNQSDKADSDAFDMTKPKNFYAEGITAEVVETYLDTNPDARDAIMNPFTMVVGPADDLSAIPYSVYYKVEMSEISRLLAEAAGLSTDRNFKEFLRLRSEAFLTNQYRASDIAWIHANSGPFEFTVGPYESYADKLFGVKRTFESILGVVLPAETEMAGTFQAYVSKFDAVLGLRYGYTTKTTLTPMVVMNQVYGSGEALYEYVPMAYNLPNDRDIHAEVGSKKVFIRNVMLEKFEYITKEIAKKVLRFEDASRFDFETYLRFVIGHESAHGLSFHFDGQTFGTVASAIEEGKADVFGMWFLYYLADEGVLDIETADRAVMQNLTDGLRQIRFGAEEAHAVGTIIQLNWFTDMGALRMSEAGFDFEPARFREAVVSLGDHMYNLAYNEQQSEVAWFISKWGTVPKRIMAYVPRCENVPVDIDPVFSF